MQKREILFYGALLLGILYMLIGKGEWDFNLGVNWVFIAFFNAMRYRYRKSAYEWWGPDLMEGLSMVPFVAVGMLVGYTSRYPLGVAIGSIVACLVWFLLWRMWLQERIYRFWD